ncbi:MAG: hypothetical protein ACRD99_00465 [Nitrososphaera sp.]
MSANPLSGPKRREFFRRFELSGWWLSYNRGLTYEALLKDRIIRLGTEAGLQDRWLKRILRHAVSEFAKKGLGPDYYGYHNIDHELEAAYFTLLSAIGLRPVRSGFTQKDLNYLFVAALFHDYDPQKRFDKPHEDAVERIVRTDQKIVQLINEVGLNIDIVLALIHRTAYPFRGDIADHALARMKELFSNAGIAEENALLRNRYAGMGWFLSVAERIAGYALGDFDHAMDLARKNAHALGWHPSVINERSVQYFSSLKEEKEMFEKVMSGVPEHYKRTFDRNVEAFGKAWAEELELKHLISDELKLTTVVQAMDGIQLQDRATEGITDDVRNTVSKIYREQALPIRVAEEEFWRSLSDEMTILVTLRIHKVNGDVQIIGYAKGYPLERAELRRGTADRNRGENNSAYLEGIGVMNGFWGASGGHLLRLRFLSEASRRGYKFVTGYAHRDVITQRVKKGEKIEVVRQYDPDMLDYYREDLANDLYKVVLNDSESVYVGEG